MSTRPQKTNPHSRKTALTNQVSREDVPHSRKNVQPFQTVLEGSWRDLQARLFQEPFEPFERFSRFLGCGTSSFEVWSVRTVFSNADLCLKKGVFAEPFSRVRIHVLETGVCKPDPHSKKTVP